MPKIRILLTFAIVLLNGVTSAQNKFIDVFAGVTAGLTENSDLLQKYSLKNIKTGLNTGADFSLGLFDNAIRYGGGIAFASKGEKYNLNDSIKFSSDINYIEIQPFAKYYIPSAPVYFGAGFYLGFSTLKKVNQGDDFVPSYEKTEPTEYYKSADYGAVLHVGAEINCGAVNYFAALKFQYGLANISNRENREIFNRSISINFGVNFLIINKNYRH